MVQVKVAEGLLEGEEVINEYGGVYYSFKGIPYAQPPVGELRFKAPLPPATWEGVRSAKEFGSKCYQCDTYTGIGILGSEDCLYLNVYTPNVKPDKPLPVMFWIHGGSLMIGGGEDDFHGPEFLVKKDVILVTINYRLEVLGFLCLNTEDVPGNAGMKDQVQALRWVNKNIASFGGDTKNITIFGSSAGAASVTYHLVSEMTKGLFNRAIAQSGSFLCGWAPANEPRDRALALARKLGCYSEDDKELYDFFMNQPVEALVVAFVPITLFEKAVQRGDMYFSVVSEKKFNDCERFFYGDLHDAVANGVHEGVAIMMGFTSEEGLMDINSGDALIYQLEMARNYPEYFVSKPLAMKVPVSQQLEIGKKIRQFYFNDQIKIPDDWEKLMKFHSMDIFIYGTIRWARICVNSGKNYLFLYKFSCKSERNFTSRLIGLTELVGNKPVTCHGDDLLYMFNASLLDVKTDVNSDTHQLIERVTTLWTNFAKFGNPTPDGALGVYWPKYCKQDEIYMEIGNELACYKAPYKEELNFWDKIYKECGLFYNEDRE